MYERIVRGSSPFIALLLVAGAPLGAAVAAPPAVSPTVMKLLQRFDANDFDAYSKQDWKLFREIHCKDVAVTFPDGHVTHGIEKHVEDMKQMFVATPDMRVSSHPISFGAEAWASSLTAEKRTSPETLVAGDWTATVGVLEATFTKPMKMGEKTIPPNGKKLKLEMVTVTHWKNGCIAEELLFWDNAAYMQQLGVQP